MSALAAPNSPPPAETRFLEVVFPEQSNHYGTLFGGTALSLMGKAAFVAASRRARSAVVMAASDKVEFHMPVQVGQIVELVAEVVRVGASSMTVVVEVVAENLVSGQRTLAMKGGCEMVAVDESGAPSPIRGIDNTCQSRKVSS
ncbi:MAG: acyl-CoA thioesterase [Proteobacteria bacterium]|nr:acyl-CoA thioesterase [Pseudomonadota bacterium]